MDQIPIFRHSSLDIIIQSDDDFVLQRFCKTAGIVFINAGKYIGIISGCYNQIKLCITGHGAESLPFRCDADFFCPLGNGLKVAIGGHVHLPGHGTKCRLRMQDGKADIAICQRIGQRFRRNKARLVQCRFQNRSLRYFRLCRFIGAVLRGCFWHRSHWNR